MAALQFGTGPWWVYFSQVLGKSYYMPRATLLVGILLFSLKNPLHELTWVVIPFFLVHLFLDHKELRFVFPLLLPVLLMIAQIVNEMKMVRRVVAAVTLLFLPLTVLRMASSMEGEVGALNTIWDQSDDTVYYIYHDPLKPHKLWHHYYDPNKNIVSVDSLTSGMLVFEDRREVQNLQRETLFQEIPEWIVSMGNWNAWADRTYIFGLYRIE